MTAETRHNSADHDNSADHEHAAKLAEMLAALDSGAVSIELLTVYREIIRLAVESLRDTDRIRAEYRLKMRDAFACSAIEGLLARGDVADEDGPARAYEVADGMIAVRGSKP